MTNPFTFHALNEATGCYSLLRGKEPMTWRPQLLAAGYECAVTGLRYYGGFHGYVCPAAPGQFISGEGMYRTRYPKRP